MPNTISAPIKTSATTNLAMKTVPILFVFCLLHFESHALSRHSRNAKRTNFVDDAIMVDDGIPMPRFIANVQNQTVTAGRSAQLTCKVKDLGNYKVAWVRVDTQTILTIHHNIITRNQRISLSHHDHKIWRLHINNIQESDRGWYMCQINTDPMVSERGFLEVVVPPSIIDARTSADIVVKEGSPVNLSCDARGSPRPKIMWKREDGDLIRYNGGSVSTVDGNSLVFPSVSRAHVGEYLCIASNGVPPSISKRIVLRVQFAPMIWIQNQLEYAIVGRNVSLQCNTESFPPAIHYWRTENGSAISSGHKYKVLKHVEKHVTKVTLVILDVSLRDFGSYSCVAKNPLGESDGTIKLSERIVVSPTWPTTTTTATPAYSGGNGNAPRGTEETSSGGDPFWNNGPRDNLPRHRTESHSRRIFSGSDSENLSYDPFLPSTANPENTWDTNDKDRFPLFGRGSAANSVMTKWTLIVIVLITTIY